MFAIYIIVLTQIYTLINKLYRIKDIEMMDLVEEAAVAVVVDYNPPQPVYYVTLTNQHIPHYYPPSARQPPEHSVRTKCHYLAVHHPLKLALHPLD